MLLEHLIIAVFCWIDDELQAAGLNDLRARGPEPTLRDCEILAIEVAGEYLGLRDDATIFRHFREHYSHLFPGLRKVHRTTVTRQMANLWAVKQQLHKRLTAQLIPHEFVWLVDSMPVHACRFGRAKFCKRFRCQAAYGYDHGSRHTFYGFRLHVRVSVEGVILAFELAPGNAAEKSVLPELGPRSGTVGIGDRAFWDPRLREELRQSGIAFYSPYQHKKRDPDPERSRQLARIRYLIETVQGQLAERCGAKLTRARDLWHLQNRLTRKVLCHTLMVRLLWGQGNFSLRIAELVSD
jgi:hypothetical protein